MSPPTNIDGTEITGASIDGQDVQEITVDGQTVFSAIPDSLVYQYRFDDDTDTSTAIDSVGTADATINGASYSSPSFAGDFALLFDGVDDSVQLPFSDVFNGGDFTVVFAGRSSSSNRNLALSNNNGQAGRFDLSFHFNGSSHLFLDGLSRTLSGTTSTNDGSYHKIALRRTGDLLELIIDDTVEDSITEAATPDNSVNYDIGTRPANNRANMTGELDEFVFANASLSDAEIANHPYV